MKEIGAKKKLKKGICELTNRTKKEKNITSNFRIQLKTNLGKSIIFENRLFNNSNWSKEIHIKTNKTRARKIF